MNIEYQPFYNKLTLTAKKKTQKLIELKAQKSSIGRYDYLLLTLFVLSLLHITFNLEYYIILYPINIVIQPFIDLSNTAGAPVTPNISVALFSKVFYYIILASAIIPGILLPKIASSKKKAADKYEALRKDIIKLIDAGFCTCSNDNCICKDQYIDYMDKHEHIDLIF